jgi:Carboxypeptidase regulatory-like domain
MKSRLSSPVMICVLLLLFATVEMVAQSPRGTLTGTIADAQGARMPGVEVIAKHVGTNQNFKAITSEDGTYAIPSLPVGKFEVTAALTGFSTFKRTDVVLEVGQRLRLDIMMNIGAVTETMTVSGDVSRVQTEDSSLGSIVERERIEQLPLNGRHVFNLVKLVAGVQPRLKDRDGFAEVDNQGFSQISFNGGPTYSNQFFVDGAMNTVPVHNEISVVPMVDAIEEFKVNTNALAAEYGQTSGGVINVATKGGTNEFHGSLYEFFRNDALDARNAFATQRDPRTGKIKPVLRYNQYGGTAGGPIRLPGLYNGKDKSFFFVGYERWNHRQSNINRATVPTAAERRGDFSNTRNAQGQVIPIYDPMTTRANPNGSGFIRDVFQGNVIPRERLDALSLRVMEYLPLPNATPDNALTNVNNYLSLEPFPTDQATLSMRVDHRFSDKDSLFGRYSRNRNTRKNRSWGMGPADTDARDDQRDNHNVLISASHIFSPTMINELRAGATRQYLVFQHPSFDQDFPSQLGFPSIFPQDAFPAVQIEGMLFFGSGRGGFAAGHRRQHTVQVADSLTIVKGKHTLKVGTDQRWVRLNFVNRLNPSGNFGFNSGLTNDPQRTAGTGFGMATFLLGEVSTGSQSVRPFFSFHTWSNGSYIQDDFKVTRRLTLNMGLRYDVSSGPVERWDRSSNFDPFVANPQTNTPGALLYAGVTKDRHFTLPPKENFGPRFGFAYDLTGDGKTSLRAGYGLIYSMLESGDTAGDTSNSLGFSVDTPFVSPISGPFKAFQFSQGPTSLLVPLGVAGGPSAFRGQNVRYQALKASTPYVQQWNLTLQRELPGKWVVSGTYAGNRGVHLFGSNYNINQMDPKYFDLGLALQDQVTNPYFGQIASGGLSGPTVARSQLLRPFPDYLNITTLADHGAASTYHSFQLTAERRLSHGLTAMISYTNSKLINDSRSENSGGGAPGDFRVGNLNRRLDRSINEDDIPQRLVVSAVYELPFGKQQKFLANGGVLSHIVGGWQVNGIGTFQSGDPLVVRGANNFTGINWPNVIGDPTLPESERTVTRWFNTDMFRNPANFTIGNVGRVLPNTRGPGLSMVDFSVFRNISFSEQTKLEFRGEFFNLLNQVNYGNPNVTFSPNPQGTNTNANFGRITTALPARRIQLGIRLTF